MVRPGASCTRLLRSDRCTSASSENRSVPQSRCWRIRPRAPSVQASNHRLAALTGWRRAQRHAISRSLGTDPGGLGAADPLAAPAIAAGPRRRRQAGPDRGLATVAEQAVKPLAAERGRVVRADPLGRVSAAFDASAGKPGTPLPPRQPLCTPPFRRTGRRVSPRRRDPQRVPVLRRADPAMSPAQGRAQHQGVIGPVSGDALGDYFVDTIGEALEEGPGN